MRVANLVLRINVAPTLFLAFVFRALYKPTNALIARTQKRTNEKIEKWNSVRSNFQRRANALSEEVQQSIPLPEKRRAEILVAISALKEETKDYCETASAGIRLPAVFVLLQPLITYAQENVARRKQKLLAWEALITKIDSDNFYSDLVLWFIVPDAFSEVLLGDLNEEYLIRKSKHGPSQARAWYRHQVTTTIRDCLWKKIERLAVIGTLLDLLFRSYKK
jgi:hypothetical protein